MKLNSHKKVLETIWFKRRNSVLKINKCENQILFKCNIQNRLVRSYYLMLHKVSIKPVKLRFSLHYHFDISILTILKLSSNNK